MRARTAAGGVMPLPLELPASRSRRRGAVLAAVERSVTAGRRSGRLDPQDAALLSGVRVLARVLDEGAQEVKAYALAALIAELRRSLAELGLTPVARARLGQVEDTDDEVSDLLAVLALGRGAPGAEDAGDG